MILRLKILAAFLFLGITLSAQETKPPYWNDIQAFKKQDSAAFPGTGKILFVGSSSFTKWKDVQEYFPGHPIVNRGFGGSTLLDVTRYEADAIFPYQPKQIVIYCGENDIANDSSVTGKMVFERFKQLFTDIRSKFPEVPVIYISMKPSPSRWHMRDRVMDGNKRIRKMLKKKKHTVFVSVWNDMLGPDGEPVKEIFIEDKLHMNAKGYAIWQKLIEPYLLK
ncbi:MAG TPA: GDSL-type esterase/lipase family protein [Ferruginibacter sp.]|nr:GDSL-type esterase/lipase family protein [Ferruginibacter sp.]